MNACFPLSLTFALTVAATAAEWPQFRGPGARGVDDRRPVPTEWNLDSGHNLRWRTPVPGLAHAAPILWSNRVYLATAVAPGTAELKVGLYGDIGSVPEKDVQEWRLLSLDVATGKVLWDVAAHQAVPRTKRHPKASHCNSTPATDGRRLVAIFGSEGLFCFDLEGKPLWRKDLGPMDSGFYVVPSAQWGFASSPVLYQDKVLVLCDVQTNSFLAAFDAATGRELWRTPRQDVPTWGTPTVVEAGGRTQVVVNGWHHSGGYALADGHELWRLVGGGDIPVPTPVYAEGLIYLTSAHGNLRPLRAIRPEASGNITAPEPGGTNAAIAWVHPRQGSYMQTPLVVGSRLYACTDWGELTCCDAATGRILFSERLHTAPQGYTASPVSDGRHLFYPGETGRVIVVPVADTFSVAAVNELGETCMAAPAIQDGVLFFRTRSHLVAIGAKTNDH